MSDTTAVQHVPTEIPGELTETSLTLAEGLTLDEWTGVMMTLRQMSRSIQWWAGDALAYGEDHFGESAFAHLEQSDKTLANWASTCRRIAPEIRNPDVGYSVHAEVASLPVEEQVNVLEEAAREGWTVGQTRERVRQIQQQEAEEEHGPSEVVIKQRCPTCDGDGEIIVESDPEAVEADEPLVTLREDNLGGDAA